LAPSHVRSTSVTAAAAASHAEGEKHAEYANLAHQYIIQPVAIETLGSIGPESRVFLNKLCKLLIAKTGNLKEGASAYFRQRISIAMARGNCASVVGSLPDGAGIYEDDE